MSSSLICTPPLKPVVEPLLAKYPQHTLIVLDHPHQLPQRLSALEGQVFLPEGAFWLEEGALEAPVDLILPRVHNLPALLLGDEPFRQLFARYDGGICFALGNGRQILFMGPEGDCQALCYLADTCLGLEDGSLRARLTAYRRGWDFFQLEMDLSILEGLMSNHLDSELVVQVPKGSQIEAVPHRELLLVKEPVRL